MMSRINSLLLALSKENPNGKTEYRYTCNIDIKIGHLNLANNTVSVTFTKYSFLPSSRF